MSTKENLPHPTKLREYLFKRIIKDMVNDFFCVVPLSDQSRLSRYHHELMRFLQRTRSEEFAIPLNGAFQNLVGAFTYTIGAREKMMTTLNKVLEIYLEHYKLGSCKYPEKYEEILQEFKEQIRKINSRLDILDIQSSFMPSGVSDAQQLDMQTLQSLQEFAARHSIPLSPQIGMIYEHSLRGMDTQNLFHVFQIVNCAPSQDLNVLADCFNLYLSMLKTKSDLHERAMQSQKQQIFAVQNQVQPQFQYQDPTYFHHQQQDQNQQGFDMGQYNTFENNEREFVVEEEAEFCTDFDAMNAYELQVGGNSDVGDYELDDAENEEQEVRNDFRHDESFLKESLENSFEKEFSWNQTQPKQNEFTHQLVLPEKRNEYYQPSNGNESTADGRDSFTSDMQFGGDGSSVYQESVGGMNYSGLQKEHYGYEAGVHNESHGWDFDETFRLGDI
eukprot:CAMPEP_0114997730 /NCGR_PEP_ID=MMETSP0216-20121206/15070_1 /TAXON_ID=223996 /ORGANISM="Protocruzia adherens, Strain Boccale" /LENGTH=444 /DNA_ID=CAMNT_0002362161 /DNA_START=107 /DNA_END=1441 /DNA_ORIENTATION=+